MLFLVGLSFSVYFDWINGRLCIILDSHRIARDLIRLNNSVASHNARGMSDLGFDRTFERL